MMIKYWKSGFYGLSVLLCLFLGLCSFIGQASDGLETHIDSLNKRLNSGISDSTEKLKILNSLSMSYWKNIAR